LLQVPDAGDHRPDARRALVALLALILPLQLRTLGEAAPHVQAVVPRVPSPQARVPVPDPSTETGQTPAAVGRDVRPPGLDETVPAALRRSRPREPEREEARQGGQAQRGGQDPDARPVGESRDRPEHGQRRQGVQILATC
jgi:hypothetical protein